MPRSAKHVRRTYQNPIVPGYHPDPSICRVGEDYYLVNSSFEYFPGVPIYHSRDLTHWRQIGHCLTRRSQLDLEGAMPGVGGIYAPTIRHHDGTFYMITTNVSNPDPKRRNFIVTTRDPAGEWSDPIYIDARDCDPSLFFHEGKAYFTRSGNNQAFIDLKTGELSQQKQVLNDSWNAYPEGPHLFRVNGRWALTWAGGATYIQHKQMIAFSDNPWDFPPPYKTILTHQDNSLSRIQALGHSDIVEDHLGGWWLVCLGIRVSDIHPPSHHLGRETFLAPIAWVDGWPVVGSNGTLSLEMEADCLPEQPFKPEPARDDFNAPALRPCWNYVRNPVEKHYSLTDRPGWLRLTASPVTLTEVGNPTLLARRQEHMNGRFAALCDFRPLEGEEAGLTIRVDEFHHYELAVTRREGRLCVIAKVTTNGLSSVVCQEPIPEGPVRLEIVANAYRYEFAFAAAGGAGEAVPLPTWRDEVAIGRRHFLSTRHISAEVAAGFTGVMMGLYATGQGSQAFFDWFDYEGRR
jgi:alpha-N-arabinofuranosidase